MLIEDILNGKHDDELDEIYQAIRDRESVVRKKDAKVMMHKVEVGDKVRLKDLTPKRINGKVVEVVGKKRTRIAVDLEGRRTLVPANCTEIVD